MARLEQIIEDVKKLPTEEKLRLRAALEQLTGNGDELSPYRTREDEREWLEAHRDEFLDQWVVLEADQLVAHGTDARIVYNEARAKGIGTPYLVHVTPKADPYVGGSWVPCIYSNLKLFTNYGREKDHIEVPVTLLSGNLYAGGIVGWLTMWNDEIVEETRQVRDRYAAKFEYDRDAIYRDLKKQEVENPEKFISLPPKQPEIIPQAKAS